LWFLVWTGVGFLLVLGVLSILSFGFLVLAVGLVAAIVAYSRRRFRMPESMGLLAGAGCVALLVAALHLDHTPCPTDGGLVVKAGETSASCGGMDPVPWAVVGAAILMLAVVAFLISSYRWHNP
jgi:hypothetical protein